MEENQIKVSEIKEFLSINKINIHSDKISEAFNFLSLFGIRITKLLGSGSFGVVAKGIDLDNRELAIKMIVTQTEEDARLNEKEGENMKEVNHINVAQVYNYFYDKQSEMFFIIMEYCSQGNLNNWVKDKNLNQKEIIQIFKQILAGLDAIHKKKIIHGDIKPQNILVANDNSIKITDFGLSKKLIGQQSHNSNGQGTPCYSAIEQIDHQRSYQQSDIFSVGLVLCELSGINFIKNFQLISRLKLQQFPPANQYNFPQILEIAYTMMATNYRDRATIPQVQEKIWQLESQIQQSAIIESSQLEKSQDSQLIKQESLYSQFKQQNNQNNNNPNSQIIGEEQQQQIDLEYGIYLGQSENGVQNGYGVFLYSIGECESLEGFWQGGICKQGKLKFKDGTVYEGQMEDQEVTGLGKYIFNDGNIYEGYVQEGLMHGYGKLQLISKNERYEGMFQLNQFHGQGTYYYKNGSIYQGNWENGQRNGKGSFKRLNSDTYEGYWEKDKMSSRIN